MELADYNMFIHIKGKNNVLADAISRLKTFNIYKEPLGSQKAQVVKNTQEVVTEVCATCMHTVNTSTLCTKQMWDKTCKTLMSQYAMIIKTVLSQSLCLQVVS